MGKFSHFILPTMVLTAAMSMTSCNATAVATELKKFVPPAAVGGVIAFGLMTLNDTLRGGSDDDQNQNDDDRLKR